MGIDPGLRYTGVGIICDTSGTAEHLGHDVISLPAHLSPAERLAILLDKMEMFIEKFSPHIISLEKAFFGKNADSAFKLGLARGVIMAVAAKNNIRVVEFAAKAVKKGITGHGAAEKDMVALFVKRLLKVDVIKRTDASDALALALFGASYCDKENLLISRGLET
jgi:crossover junction endodeoxyribonuclease RuvC